MTQRKRKIMKTLHLPHSTLLLISLLIMIGKGEAETVRCPRYCTCYLNTTDNMRSVSCVARRLDNIDLSVPKRVQSLDLSNNSISVIEDRGFQSLGLIEVIKLVLRHNSIRTVGLHSFAGLTYLEWVDLTDNNLYQILPWTFHDNSNLKYICLSSNPLGHIVSSGPLLDVPSLEALELSKCNFGHFSEDAFSALPSLKRLDISHNQLISFDIYTLQFLYNLEELDVSKNPWPCNLNLRNLQDFLDSKSSRLIGSSCNSPATAQEIQIEPAKFEKIISAVYPVYNDVSSSEEDNKSEEAEDNPRLKETVCKCKPESPTELVLSENSSLPPTLLILVSFQLGVCVSLFLVYFWKCCTKQKKRVGCACQDYEPVIVPTPATAQHHQLPLLTPTEMEEQPTPNPSLCPDTPPPSYRELFTSPEQ